MGASRVPHAERTPMLIVLAGLPGTGKSSIARMLAAELGAVWLRVDSIEQALRESGDLADSDPGKSGYLAAYALAYDNLRVGRIVIGDSVNPLMLTRNAWRDAGIRTGVHVTEIEIFCSDAAEHRRRIESRRTDVPGLVLPDWQAVINRDYEPWTREPLRIDTAGRSIADCVETIRAGLPT
ncbi:MAG: AAA family ATPase [Alphaproteobacteria bacterium]